MRRCLVSLSTEKLQGIKERSLSYHRFCFTEILNLNLCIFRVNLYGNLQF